MKRFFIFVFIVWSVCTFGQDKHPDSLWLLKTGSSNPLSDLQKGYNTFYFDAVSELKNNEDGFNQLLSTQRQVLLLYNRHREKLQDFLDDSLKIFTKPPGSSKENEIIGIETNQLNYIPFVSDSLSEIEVCKEFNLISVDSLKSKKEIDFFLEELLFSKGVVPDIISSPFIKDIEYLKKEFYKKPIYKARITYNNEELNKVGWKEFPHLETCGVFRTSASTLSPQKRGFMFSPDIYNFTDENRRISGPKTFRAIKYEIEEKLRYSLPLDGQVANLANKDDKSTATDVEFEKDTFRDKRVSIFNGSSSYIDIRSRPEDRLEEISISAWIKPDEVDGSFSLIG
ncbi:hypothetical protein, partial [uncultured Salegentibacter sp.]